MPLDLGIFPTVSLRESRLGKQTSVTCLMGGRNGPGQDLKGQSLSVACSLCTVPPPAHQPHLHVPGPDLGFPPSALEVSDLGTLSGGRQQDQEDVNRPCGTSLGERLRRKPCAEGRRPWVFHSGHLT